MCICISSWCVYNNISCSISNCYCCCVMLLRRDMPLRSCPHFQNHKLSSPYCLLTSINYYMGNLLHPHVFPCNIFIYVTTIEIDTHMLAIAYLRTFQVGLATCGNTAATNNSGSRWQNQWPSAGLQLQAKQKFKITSNRYGAWLNNPNPGARPLVQLSRQASDIAGDTPNTCLLLVAVWTP